MDRVVVGDGPLTTEHVRRVAKGAGIQLHPSAIERIRAGRAVVDSAIAAALPIYGVNTGVGHLKDVRLAEEALCRSQETLIRTHAGGIGPPESTEVVRAALLVRVNGLSQGGSGASVAVAEVLTAMLNSGVHPIVPRHGSVGAADLSQMAAIGLVAMGEGQAEFRGEILSGAEALRRAGIDPLVVRPKDGLALVSANGISIGQGALVTMRAVDLAEVADVVAALSLEAVRGNPSLMLPVVAAAKPYPGQIAAARNMQTALEGSYLLEPGAPASIQDPLSFRVVPQVHGALREFTSFARRSVEMELNSISDNPLVSTADGTMVHNGNFHPIVLAIAFDALRTALAHVGQLSERRLGHLWDSFFANLGGDGNQPAEGMEKFFGLWLRYGGAAQLAELKQLAAPATLDVPPLDMEIEDHATSAPLSVRKTCASLELLESILAIELLLARDVLSLLTRRPQLGKVTGRALEAVEKALAGAGEIGSAAAVHELVRGVVGAEAPFAG